MVLCVAVFNKEDCLLFSRTKNSERGRELELEAFIYCSYDIIGEKVRLAMDKTAQECYLGSLLLNNTFRSYGYLTNTNVKFLLVVDVANQLLKDHDIRAIFKRLHADYCKSISNPFYQLNSPLRSRYLVDTCDEIFET